MSKIFEIDGIRRAKGKGEPHSSAAPSGAQPAAHSRLAQRAQRAQRAQLAVQRSRAA